MKPPFLPETGNQSCVLVWDRIRGGPYHIPIKLTGLVFTEIWWMSAEFYKLNPTGAFTVVVMLSEGPLLRWTEILPSNILSLIWWMSSFLSVSEKRIRNCLHLLGSNVYCVALCLLYLQLNVLLVQSKGGLDRTLCGVSYCHIALMYWRPQGNRATWAQSVYAVLRHVHPVGWKTMLMRVKGPPHQPGI